MFKEKLLFFSLFKETFIKNNGEIILLLLLTDSYHSKNPTAKFIISTEYSSQDILAFL